MNPREAVRTVLLGIKSDLADYQQLEGLLDTQFRSALVPNANKMSDVSAAILSVCATLDERRRERTRLVQALTGKADAAGMELVLSRLPEPLGESCRNAWTSLQERVVQCRSLNQRNGELMTTQQQVLERVLYGDGRDVYAPEGYAS